MLVWTLNDEQLQSPSHGEGGDSWLHQTYRVHQTFLVISQNLSSCSIAGLLLSSQTNLSYGPTPQQLSASVSISSVYVCLCFLPVAFVCTLHVGFDLCYLFWPTGLCTGICGRVAFDFSTDPSDSMTSDSKMNDVFDESSHFLLKNNPWIECKVLWCSH